MQILGNRGWVRTSALLVIGIAVGVWAVTSAGQIAGLVDQDISDRPTAKSAENETTTTELAQSRKGINATAVELAIHRRVNEIRQERGRPTLRWDSTLSTIAGSHSKDMASKGYFSHTSPSGEDFEDRYESHGYVCQVRSSPETYATGAENIAYTYARTNIETTSGLVNYDGNETKIGRGVVRQWMNSDGHRKNILRTYWENEGIGVAIMEIDGKTRVYATQNFC